MLDHLDWVGGFFGFVALLDIQRNIARDFGRELWEARCPTILLGLSTSTDRRWGVFKIVSMMHGL